MEVLSIYVVQLIIPVVVILLSFLIIFAYGFKLQGPEPDFKGLSLEVEEEKSKAKKLKAKKNVKKPVQSSSVKLLHIQKPQKVVVNDVKVPEFKKKEQKEVFKVELKEAEINSDEWVVKNNRKSKKKLDKRVEEEKKNFLEEQEGLKDNEEMKANGERNVLGFEELQMENKINKDLEKKIKKDQRKISKEKKLIEVDQPKIIENVQKVEDEIQEGNALEVKEEIHVEEVKLVVSDELKETVHKQIYEVGKEEEKSDVTKNNDEKNKKERKKKIKKKGKDIEDENVVESNVAQPNQQMDSKKETELLLARELIINKGKGEKHSNTKKKRKKNDQTNDDKKLPHITEQAIIPEIATTGKITNPSSIQSIRESKPISQSIDLETSRLSSQPLNINQSVCLSTTQPIVQPSNQPAVDISSQPLQNGEMEDWKEAKTLKKKRKVLRAL